MRRNAPSPLKARGGGGGGLMTRFINEVCHNFKDYTYIVKLQSDFLIFF